MVRFVIRRAPQRTWVEPAHRRPVRPSGLAVIVIGCLVFWLAVFAAADWWLR